MIPIHNTCNTVVMLLVAGGVGLIGGIGAGLLEIRRDPKKAKECRKAIASCVLLGGIAAVAILYFFPPEEVVGSVTVEGLTKPIKEYDLTKLVALALIVGSAGANFLLVMQKKTLDLLEAEKETAEAEKESAEKEGEANTAKATASEAMVGVGNQVPALVSASVIKAATPTIRKALEKAGARKATKALPPEIVTSVLKEVAEKTEEAAEALIEPVVQDAQERILVGPPEQASEQSHPSDR
ncbi:MAG TPA: hypothetical protein VH042_12270 [Solirubrobacterales bacterium]|jgi:hypothetical protein|nr:hypothetical protein [Solirubrobacterales bacterium]